MDNKHPTLKVILREMCAHADSAPLTNVHVRLKNGLSVQVVREPQRYLLEIIRSGVWPSEHEWKVVCANWPYMLYPIQAEPEERGRFRVLRARVRVNPQKELFNST